MTKTLLSAINSDPSLAARALKNLYRRKTYAVGRPNGHIDTFKKTKRGAEGYIKREQQGSYYDDYLQEMVSYGSDMFYEEIKEQDILNPAESLVIWFRYLKSIQGQSYLYDQALKIMKSLSVSEEVKNYVITGIDDMKNNRGLIIIEEEPTEELEEKNETQQQQTAPEAQQPNQESENHSEAVTATYRLNEEKNGVELYFSGKPSEEIRNVLKAHGFRWSRNKKCWYAKQSDETISLAKQLAGENDTQATEQTENDYNSHLTTAQKETLSKRLEKENVKPLRLFKKEGFILLECINLNLSQENQKPFYFLIFGNGQESGKGYSYPLDGFELIHTFEQTEKPITAAIEYPEINIDDNDQYIIDQSLIDREHNSHWIFRTQKRDHNKEIRELFNHYTEKTKEVIATTENEYYIFKLKEALQRFKKHYHQTYIKYLTAKADNPSWAVTGRAGRNTHRDQKVQDRENRYMLEVVYLPKQFEKELNKYKDKIRKDEKEALKKRIEQAEITVPFKTETKEFTYMGLKEKKRVYSYQNYWICRLWGCYRIFKDEKEIHDMRTTDKLEDAKKYISMLVQSEQNTTDTEKVS
ncbi:hypothetical protein [Bacillus smithii]|uniref:hypothetical protein n=1 Tax=Bacillus smithii TaxID=1479 RepID=UPI003D1DF44F